ncbi:hypothetical protein Patl1_33734 [Pistacia atlantica]|uniref:Uncharacterized protein n=1 Tax=Pistacia atlantica TaxID=434234 RepID=A0ACC0ZTC6_9ROSI|nr:hypothetical protein Patl1_33734 [Pistacia atlantica]
MDLFPSVEALVKNGKNRTLQAIELESGIGHQWRLWKWTSYCTLESACWAMAKSWLDVQVDLELAHSQVGRMEQLKSYGDDIEGNSGQMSSTSPPLVGPESWPLQVLNQQPRDLFFFFRNSSQEKWYMKLLLEGARSSNDKLSSRALYYFYYICKGRTHRIFDLNCMDMLLNPSFPFCWLMKLMLGNIPHLLELLWSWIAPSEDDQNVFREELMIVGVHIIHMYVMFLFLKQHEELVGIYASQLAHHRCIDLFVHKMELRLKSHVHVKYRIFLSAMEYLPFSPGDDSKGSFEEIIERRVLSRSQEIKLGKYDKVTDVAEQHRLQSLQKAMVIQWLCFTPPSNIADVADISAKLLMRALIHREFALISVLRVPAMPIGAYALLSFFAEPLKELSETPDTLKDYVSENVKEFQDWREYYSCGATYRNWLKIELENADVPELSFEEKQRAVAAAQETLNLSLVLLQLMSALYSTMSEEVVLNRQLMICFFEFSCSGVN